MNNKIITELPKKKSGDKLIVEWNKLINADIIFLYDNELYTLKIIDYKNPYLTIEYNGKRVDKKNNHI